MDSLIPGTSTVFVGRNIVLYTYNKIEKLRIIVISTETSITFDITSFIWPVDLFIIQKIR